MSKLQPNVYSLKIEHPEPKEHLAQSEITESQWKAIQEASIDGIVTFNEKGEILWFSPSAERIFGYDASEVIGKPLDILVEEDFSQEGASFSQAILRDYENSNALDLTQEYPGKRRCGTSFPLQISIGSSKHSSGRVFAAIFKDMEEQATLQKQLRQAQKMDAIGQLAGGVAHDFNNILSVILNYASFLTQSLEEDSQEAQDVNEIITSAKRAVGLTRRLLLFSRKDPVQPEVINLNEQIGSLEKFFRRTIGAEVKLDMRLEENLAPIELDAGYLDQVLLNLIVNARDAMPHGGRINIETANVHFDHAYTMYKEPMKPGSYVYVGVTDTGCGMEPDILERSLEPFFTTKSKDNGTGLGLAIVYGIVKQSRGYIWLYSEPNIGTTVKIYFPVAKLDEIQKSIEQTSTPLQGKKETVLVVEDDPVFLRVICRILDENGYKSLGARQPLEALKICQEHEGEIDLALTDLIMPNMNGKILSKELLIHRPRTRVIHMSGYSQDMIKKRGLLENNWPFIQKPFAASDLLDLVYKTLHNDEN